MPSSFHDVRRDRDYELDFPWTLGVNGLCYVRVSIFHTFMHQCRLPLLDVPCIPSEFDVVASVVPSRQGEFNVFTDLKRNAKVVVYSHVGQSIEEPFSSIFL